MTSLSDQAVADIRADFPIFERSVFLNSCTYGALSRSVRAAFDTYLDARDEQGSAWSVFSEKHDALRRQIAAYLNASPDEIAIVGSASQALGTILSAVPLNAERMTLLMTDHEFPSAGVNVAAQAERGAQVRVISAHDTGVVSVEDIENQTDDDVAAIIAAHVCYRTGVRQDVRSIARLARSCGALSIVDGYQYVGSGPVDVKALGCDVYVGGTSKFMLGASGTAFLYVRKDLIASLNPLATGWYAQADIAAMDHATHRPSDTARRFETGAPNSAGLFAALAGLELLDKVGFRKIEGHIQNLTAHLRDGVATLGFELAVAFDSSRQSAITSVSAMDSTAAVQALADQRIVVSSRDGFIRISPHLYNTRTDIDAVLNALADHRKLIA